VTPVDLITRTRKQQSALMFIANTMKSIVSEQHATIEVITCCTLLSRRNQCKRIRIYCRSTPTMSGEFSYVVSLLNSYANNIIPKKYTVRLWKKTLFVEWTWIRKGQRTLSIRARGITSAVNHAKKNSRRIRRNIRWLRDFK